MSVGDINSAEKGSGARFNDGKPPVELLLWKEVAELLPLPTADFKSRALEAMFELGVFQETHHTKHLSGVISELYDEDFRTAMLDGARVFGYGAKKYAAWNWTKGMAWSVVLACAGRHLLAIWSGEENDPESGLPHAGHVVCNVMMLSAYQTIFREGNDLPKLAGHFAKDRDILPGRFIEVTGESECPLKFKVTTTPPLSQFQPEKLPVCRPSPLWRNPVPRP